MTTSAAELRRQAVRRMADVAGYDERLNVELTLARPKAVQILIRQACRASYGDELLYGEVRELAAIAGGKAWILDDAIHVRGMPEPTPDAAMSLEEWNSVIEEELA